MRRGFVPTIGVALAVLIGAAFCGGVEAQTSAQGAEALFTDTFETDTSGWAAFGPHAQIEQTNEAAHVKNGKGALHFKFQVGDKPGEKPADQPNALPIDVLLRPTPDGQLTKMRTLRFWARSDIGAAYAVSLSEKDGGRYMTIFWLPAEQWQQVTLQPSDFWLSDDKNDPKDPDGKLDLDQVENIGLINVWSFLALSAGDSPESVALMTRFNGAHSLWLDDFTASSAPLIYDAPEPTMPTQTKGVWIDDLRRNTLAWLPLGTTQMRLDSSAPFKNRAVRLDYDQGDSKFVALIHDMRRVNLAHVDRLTFEVASAKSIKLIISLEEKNGAKYNGTLDVPGDSVPTRKSIPFSDFTLADDSPKDPNGQLDLNQVKTLTIVDITSAFGLDKQKNTLWIGPIRALSLNL